MSVGDPVREDPAKGHDASPVRYERVSKQYPGAEGFAVHELSLEVPAGEICVLDPRWNVHPVNAGRWQIFLP